MDAARRRRHDDHYSLSHNIYDWRFRDDYIIVNDYILCISMNWRKRSETSVCLVTDRSRQGRIIISNPCEFFHNYISLYAWNNYVSRPSSHPNTYLHYIPLWTWWPIYPYFSSSVHNFTYPTLFIKSRIFNHVWNLTIYNNHNNSTHCSHYIMRILFLLFAHAHAFTFILIHL